MPQQVCMGATLMCTFGLGPSNLVVTPKGMPVETSDLLAATVQDFVPIANIPPFPACVTLSNPTVAAATAAKLGVFTPAPCLPVVTSPWTPGVPTVMINKIPALNNTSTCMCQWGGVISITVPGQVTVND